ncbi:MAG: polyphosphate kinase 2 family protein [Planctomycetaceae bacterium]|nr:polyphosphate kinase 2 family protein [Planctomycetaceae bacterium]
MLNSAIHRIPANMESISLRTTETDGKDLCSERQDAESAFRDAQAELIDWQERLYAEGKQSLLVVFQAIDAGGKDGTIRAVFSGLNPQGVTVTPFKAPSAEELAHDFLWRIHKAVPARGMTGVFNRSHYEDVLAVRVHQLAPESVWRPRFELINQFEQQLHLSGVRIVKFLLHVSRKEQRQRFQERLDDPAKRWKFDRGDLEKRRLWKDYEAAFEEVLQRCSTATAPWYVIPADQNWYRNWAVCDILVHTLREMNPQYPPAPDLSDVVIDD